MLKVHILIICVHCHGRSYLPVREKEDYKGEKYTRTLTCPICLSH